MILRLALYRLLFMPLLACNGSRSPETLPDSVPDSVPDSFGPPTSARGDWSGVTSWTTKAHRETDGSAEYPSGRIHSLGKGDFL